MIRGVVSHKWLRPQYSVVVLEVVPASKHRVVDVTIVGEDLYAIPKEVSFSTARDYDADHPRDSHFELLIEALPCQGLSTVFQVPLGSMTRYVRFDFEGLYAEEDGTARKQPARHCIDVNLEPASSAGFRSNIGASAHRTPDRASGGITDGDRRTPIRAAAEGSPAATVGRHTSQQRQPTPGAAGKVQQLSALRTEINDLEATAAKLRETVAKQKVSVGDAMEACHKKLQQEFQYHQAQETLSQHERLQLLAQLRPGLRTPPVLDPYHPSSPNAQVLPMSPALEVELATTPTRLNLTVDADDGPSPTVVMLTPIGQQKDKEQRTPSNQRTDEGSPVIVSPSSSDDEEQQRPQWQ